MQLALCILFCLRALLLLRGESEDWIVWHFIVQRRDSSSQPFSCLSDFHCFVIAGCISPVVEVEFLNALIAPLGGPAVLRFTLMLYVKLLMVFRLPLTHSISSLLLQITYICCVAGVGPAVQSN